MKNITCDKCGKIINDNYGMDMPTIRFDPGSLLQFGAYTKQGEYDLCRAHYIEAYDIIQKWMEEAQNGTKR